MSNINKSAFEYNKFILNDLQSFITPLTNNNIKTFSYSKFDKSDKYFCVCNNLSWLEEIYSYTIITARSLSLNHNITTAAYQTFLWPYFPLEWPTIETKAMLLLLDRLDIRNGLSIIKVMDSTIELWWFSLHHHVANSNNFYLHNLEYFKQFITYFSHTFSINNDDKIYAKYNINRTVSILANKNSFLNIDETDITILSKPSIITSQGEIMLSNREYECLNYIAHGKTAKEIASTLNLSPRSIELYIKNIKNKLNVNNKFEAVKLFKQSAQNWL